jgi:predicted acylesterase/phospholipase RssA
VHSGRGVARALRGLFDDVQIEDLWSTYVAVCSNLTRGSVAAHSRGPLRKYVRASISVPGLLPPVTDGGELLVDGGVLNNLPADIARDLVGTGAVIAVDVNPQAGLLASEDYGEVLDGWEVAWRRMNPRARPLVMPGIHDLLERMTMLGSIQQAAQTVQATADLYLHPPTDMVPFLDFSAMDVHIQRGYEFARPLVRSWAERTGYAARA